MNASTEEYSFVSHGFWRGSTIPISFRFTGAEADDFSEIHLAAEQRHHLIFIKTKDDFEIDEEDPHKIIIVLSEAETLRLSCGDTERNPLILQLRATDGEYKYVSKKWLVPVYDIIEDGVLT